MPRSFKTVSRHRIWLVTIQLGVILFFPPNNNILQTTIINSTCNLLQIFTTPANFKSKGKTIQITLD
jgi:hypothetical protein